jgi:CRP-like cAMP-binding protein
MAHVGNQLIDLLPRTDKALLLSRCEPFALTLSAELSVRGRILSHAYFPLTGFVSLVIDVDNYPALEVGMVGRESMLGSELLLGLEPTPWRALVQGEGKSLRIPAAALREILSTSVSLRQLVQASLLARLHQQTLACACERFHMIGPRLARWLLMSQDRAGSDSFHLTQEFMALMLGVRRVGVTVAAGELQQANLIRYHRGELTVIDRAGLEAQACSCYANDKAIQSRLTGRRR